MESDGGNTSVASVDATNILKWIDIQLLLIGLDLFEESYIIFHLIIITNYNSMFNLSLIFILLKLGLV